MAEGKTSQCRGAGSFVDMAVNVLAEAGLSECVRTDMDCMPGFGLFLAMWAVAGLLLMVWPAAALYATVAVVSSKLGVTRTVLWILAVWILPLLGVMVWFVHARSQHSPVSMSRTP
ncbi:PLD nuclease N-terminal domain-containing protein [Prescottella soli]|uniref:PLD nuclease N-terminal domain-containing protein n=1 Tax=Prescottella soli TaxID=1543852 RepID=A0ABW9FZY7_9NOCA